MDTIAPFPISHWVSLGYNQEHDIVAMMQLNISLIVETFKLKDCLSQTSVESVTNADIDIAVGIENDAVAALPESPLPDDSLLPLWKEFATALVALATNEREYYIDLAIGNIQLSTPVLNILGPALNTASLEKLSFVNNRLGIDGIKFVTSVLDGNRSLGKLTFWKNEIGCGHEAFSLLETARNHPALYCFVLGECSIRRILPIAPEIVPFLLSLQTEVDLQGNRLGSPAASLISNCLATNPSIQYLRLCRNSFNDDDARLFAYSLRTNTNLAGLMLNDNIFTDDGIKTLYRSVYDVQSPSTIYDSNHTCKLYLFREDARIPNGIDDSVLSVNGKRFEPNIFPESLLLRCERDANGNDAIFGIIEEWLQIEGRKKVKMLHAIQGGNTGRFNMLWIENIPVELMPKVLVFLQESGKYAGTEERSLDRLFQVIRARQEVTSFHNVPDE